MKEKIFEEIRRLKLGKTHVWLFQQYNPFKYSLDPTEQRVFESTMADLCNEGIFVAESNGSVIIYRLTEKGEKIIYSR